MLIRVVLRTLMLRLMMMDAHVGDADHDNAHGQAYGHYRNLYNDHNHAHGHAHVYDHDHGHESYDTHGAGGGSEQS